MASQPQSKILKKDLPITLGSVLAFLALFVGYEVSIQFGLLLLVGSGLGFAMYHGAVSFAGGWRNFLVRGDRYEVGQHALIILVTAILLQGLIAFAPDQYRGAVAPISWSLLCGSFVFGIGMQLANGCGSGVLYALGAGSTRMIIALVAFCAGALLGSFHLPFWLSLGSFEAVHLPSSFGVFAGLLATIIPLGLIYLWANRDIKNSKTESLVSGPWSIWLSVIAISILSSVVMLLSGGPWSVTFGFTVWAAKIANVFGYPVEAYEFWQWPRGKAALENSILSEVTSITNIGLLFGAAMAARLRGKFAAYAWPGLKPSLAAIIGGLLLGYGARLAFGCNIGALLAGIASGSLHGWIWGVFALAGCWVGIKFRPLFGMAK